MSVFPIGMTYRLANWLNRVVGVGVEVLLAVPMQMVLSRALLVLTTCEFSVVALLHAFYIMQLSQDWDIIF